MIEWFDDVCVGMRFKTGQKVVMREDIKRFAAEFDPQPYHLDEAAAEQSLFKGLAASGWHTAAMSMRSRRGRSGRTRCWALASMSCAGWRRCDPAM
jgi:acyl dehydratase